MPIIKSAIKRARQTATRRSHNLQVKRAVHQDARVFNDAVAGGDAAAIAESLRAAQSQIDRAVKKGTLHRNTAGRQKSRLAKLADTVLVGTAPAKKPAAKKAPAKAAAKAPAKRPAAKKTTSSAK